jgi:transmembrane sensor
MNARRGPRPAEPQDPITARAASFFERKHFGQWSHTDQRELDAWFAETIMHEVAFLRLEGHAARAERLAAFRPFRARRETWSDALRGAVRPFAWLAVSVVSLAVFTVFCFPILVSLMQPADRAYSTEVGGKTLLSFADHSQVELNSDSVIRVRMTTAERTVWVEKGEAWFQVAHDAAHPFTVIVGRQRITDLGTEFVVRRDADRVDVVLVNGRASLSWAGAQAATLVPGDEAVATPVSLSISRKSPQQLADELAWRRGELVFRNARLADVVTQFNRYNAIKLVIADPSIANERITANTRTDDYESFLQMAQDALKLRVSYQGNNILIFGNQKKETKGPGRHKHGL